MKHGPARSLSRDEIEALYGTQAPVKSAAPGVLSRKQSAVKVGRWAVARVNDDGRCVIVRSGLNSHDAHIQAGYERDHMSERDVAAGWNFLPQQVSQDTRNRSRELGDPAIAGKTLAGGIPGEHSGVEKRRLSKPESALQSKTTFVDRQS